jgi:hypothetical protein
LRVIILYRGQSEHEREVLDFVREYEHRTGRKLSLQDLNEREGSSTAVLYDVVRYPAILALADDGQLLQLWQGEPLPLMNEVMYYDKSESNYSIEFNNKHGVVAVV